MARPGGVIAWLGSHVGVMAGVGIGAVAVSWVGAMVVLGELDDVPGWWPGLDPTAPATVEAADKLERAFMSQTSRVREPGEDGGADWAVRVSEESTNAWLAVRLRDWAIDAGALWPEQVEGVRIGFEHGRVMLGVRVTHDSGASVLWLDCTPEIGEDGSLWIRLHGARVGSLRVPRAWVIGQLEQQLRAYASDAAVEGPPLADVLSGRAPVTSEPTVHLPDGRDVRVMAIGVDEERDGIVLSFRTESSK